MWSSKLPVSGDRPGARSASGDQPVDRFAPAAGRERAHFEDVSEKRPVPTKSIPDERGGPRAPKHSTEHSCIGNALSSLSEIKASLEIKRKMLLMRAEPLGAQRRRIPCTGSVNPSRRRHPTLPGHQSTAVSHAVDVIGQAIAGDHEEQKGTRPGTRHRCAGWRYSGIQHARPPL
ncbi:hypothetical protein MASSI9I_50578 [Massilia sp. 9I]|nr:hypothetical protein MASSI9I_50578 [Massilia sp. 9I]